MKIVSINVNGLRAYIKKGALITLMNNLDPDILCIQETKCADSNLITELLTEYLEDYNLYISSNTWKGGYAGVATLCKNNIEVLNYNIENILEEYGEGRIVSLDINHPEGAFTLINVYTLNSGNKDDLRLEWDKRFKSFTQQTSYPVIIVGDMNVVTNELDYWGDFAEADEYPGMKDYEIKFIDELKQDLQLIDTYRYLYPDKREYSWFSYQGGARYKNHGWRIDLALMNENLKNLLLDSKIYSDMEGSDHSPIELIIK